MSLDYNHDGIFSNAVEGISLTEVVKNNAFTGYEEVGSSIDADMFAYAANIPEPGLMVLIYSLFVLCIIYSRNPSGLDLRY
ncbi:hypothetical protein KAH27_00950 [bacterium]|nr:hypothetical protein [bacterium]